MLKSICLSLYKFHTYTLHDSTRIVHWAMQVLHMLAVIQYPIHKLVKLRGQQSGTCKAEGGQTRALVIGKFVYEPKLQASLSARIWHEPWRSTHVLHGLRAEVAEQIHTYMFACMYNVMYECTCRSIYICTHAHGCSCDMFIWICMWYNSRHLSGLTIAHRGPGMPPHRVVCADHAPRTLRAHGCVI